MDPMDFEMTALRLESELAETRQVLGTLISLMMPTGKGLLSYTEGAALLQTLLRATPAPEGA